MADEGRQRTDSSRTGEAPAERAAAEEVPELALGEARHPDAVGGSGRLREETLEVRAHDLVAVPPFGRSGCLTLASVIGATPGRVCNGQ